MRGRDIPNEGFCLVDDRAFEVLVDDRRSNTRFEKKPR